MKNKILTFLFLGYIFTFMTWGILIKKDTISYTERRKLQAFPTFNFNSDFINDLDKYFLDHFPLREDLRSLKANFNYNILNKLDNNGIYLKDDYIFKTMYPTNNNSINNFISKTSHLKSLLSKSNNIYLLIIPDKNFYLDDPNFLQIDYDYLYKELNKLNTNQIDIRDLMDLNDYYQTDTHWKQENLHKVIERLNTTMEFDYDQHDYTEKTYDQFYGVYYGESAIKRKPEVITYLNDEAIDNAKVFYLENNKLHTVYNEDKLNSFDSYEVFLDGASSFIEIENSKSKTNKELVIFRDSFGSSLTPLLIPYYKKITIIDNRYITSKQFSELIEFTNQDVLFLYSTLIVNSSFTLKG